MERVLVVFQATAAKTESLALAFGLGAVEGGALIRLRHLNSDGPSELEHQGYTTPKDTDLEWAQVIGLALESEAPQKSLEDFFNQLDEARVAQNKTVYVFGGATEVALVAHARQLLKQLGAVLVESESEVADADIARAVGRQVALQA